MSTVGNITEGAIKKYIQEQQEEASYMFYDNPFTFLFNIVKHEPLKLIYWISGIILLVNVMKKLEILLGS